MSNEGMHAMLAEKRKERGAAGPNLGANGPRSLAAVKESKEYLMKE